jgi:hypothetical protein
LTYISSDFHKIISENVISINPKLYQGKNVPKDYLDQFYKSKKQLTQYISYLEIELLSRDSQSNWRDSGYISWEKFKDFFKLFNMNFEPLKFIRSGKLNKNERYIFCTYFPAGIRIENSQIEIDYTTINIKSIYDNLYLNQDTFGYNFFFYNNLFPKEYLYDDDEYEPFIDRVPTYLQTFEISRDRIGESDVGSTMKIAFNLEEDQESLEVKPKGKK